MCPVSLTVWFLCKSCKLNFAKVDDYIEHKKENHFTEFQVQNTSCVVFEERIEIDGDLEGESGSVERTPIVLKEEFQLANDSRIEVNSDPNPKIISSFTDPQPPWQIADDVTAQAVNYCCDSESNEDVLNAKTELVTYGSQIEEAELNEVGSVEPRYNPYVLLKRLTSKEIHAASSANNPKLKSNKHLSSIYIPRPFKCNEFNCAKVFKYKKNLVTHMKCHSDLRPFGCPQCNKTYKFQYRLIEHLRSHTGERPFKCPVDNCGKTYIQSTHLGRHNREVHRVRNESRHQLFGQGAPSIERRMEGASSATTSKISLKKNVKSHFVPRSFKCLIPNCGKVLASKSSLYLHKISHSNARPFGCPHCDKTYKFNNKLVEHVRRHTPESGPTIVRWTTAAKALRNQ